MFNIVGGTPHFTIIDHSTSGHRIVGFLQVLNITNKYKEKFVILQAIGII